MTLHISRARSWIASAALLVVSPQLAAQESASPPTEAHDAEAVSPEAQAVLDRMTRYLRGLSAFSIDAQASRDEVVAMGYKLQDNERSVIVVQRPNRLRADITGDIRNRTIVYDGSKLTMYSPDDAAYVRTDAPDTLGKLIGEMLDRGIEMPLVDVLYQGTAGTLTDDVRGGILVGETEIDGVACDHLAFRHPTVDWQLWVEQGDRPLPRKILITTRYEAGAPEYQAVLHWDLKPRITRSTFAFSAPKGAVEIPLAPPANESGAP